MKKITKIMSLIIAVILFMSCCVFADMEETEVMINSGYSSIVALNKYGRVFSAGDNTYGQLMTYGWKNAVSVCAGKYFSAALLKDGTVVAAGKCENGSEIDTSAFQNIIQIDAGDNFIAALDIDGRVHLAGDYGNISVQTWEKIVKIACGKHHIVALNEDGFCLGSGSQAAESVKTFFDIEDIYAGANLTVLKDSEGCFYHTGLGVYTKENEGDAGSQWVFGSFEENIRKIKIIPGVNDVGVVIAVTEDGRIVTDGSYVGADINWSPNFLNKLLDLTDVKDIAVLKKDTNYFAAVIKNDNSFEYIFDEMEISEFTETLDTFDLEMEPLDYSDYTPQIVAGPRTIGVLLPDKSVVTIGKTLINDFYGVKNLSVTKNYVSSYEISDYFLGVTEEGNVLTNLQEEEKNEAGIPLWKGVEKAASYHWLVDDNSTEAREDNRLIGALRWDKRLYSSFEHSKNVKSLKNIIDIAGGKYFTAALSEDGRVYVESYSHSVDLSGVSEWRNIVKIFAGQNHIVGVKVDGTCISIGPSGDLTGWSDIVDVACGNNFTIGIDSSGNCYYACNDETVSYKMQKEVVESWENVDKIIGSDKYALAHKKDGTFAYAQLGNQTDFKIPLINNTYYKDNVFYTYKTEGNRAYIDYYSDRNLIAYVSFFDNENNAVDFQKVILEPFESLVNTEIESSNKDAVSCKVQIDDISAEKLSFYLEADGQNGLSINYCAEEDQKIWIAFYNDKDNLIAFKTEMLEKTDKNTLNYNIDAKRYKIFIWNGVTPVYKAEGEIK